MKHLTSFNLFEGVAEKAVRVKNKNKEVNPDRIDNFRKKIQDYVKSQDCKTKQVGNDLEVHFGDDKLSQVMFRDDYIGIKKEGNKFAKEFKYNEFGKIKSELSSIIKSNK